jgi:hypothetical protein
VLILRFFATEPVAHIFKTEYNGKPVYVISLDEEFNAELKVTQPEVKSDIESRIKALENKVNKHLESENKDNKKKWAR